MEQLRLEKFDLATHGSLADELTALLHSAYGALAQKGMRYWASHQTPAETLRRLGEGEAYLAFWQSQLAGTISLVGPKPENRAPWYRRNGVYTFHQFAVAPSLQGKKIGSQMMDWIEGRALALGAEELALDTSERADHLLAIYTKRGYRFVEHVQWDGVNYRSVILSKRLSL